MTHHTRRDFMRLACCSAATASLVGGLSKFGLVSALAQGTTDYKALVCIFLFGGNDANNMIVPIDTAGYANYQTIRANLALSQASLLPLQVGSAANFGLHPNLPDLQGLFNNQKVLAVLSNVGTLVQPTTRAAVSESEQPAGEFVLALGPAESVADDAAQRYPGRRLGRQSGGQGDADVQQQRAVSRRFYRWPGARFFPPGITTRPFTMNPGSTPGLSGIDSSTASQAKFLGVQQLLTFDTGISLVQATSAVTGQAIKESQVLATALKNIPAIQTVFPANNGLASQLKQVAQVIAARSALGISRQIFFCSAGRIRYAQRPAQYAGGTVLAVEPGDGGVLQRDARAGCGESGDHIHACRSSAAPSSRDRTAARTTPGAAIN